MAMLAFSVGTFSTGTGIADGSVLTSGSYLAIIGGAAVSQIFLDEVYMGGQAGSSAPVFMLLRRDSTNGATPTALVSPNTFGPLNPLSNALTTGPVAFIAATTQPTPSVSLVFAKKNFSFNAFGGIVRANYANTADRFGITGTATSTAEMSLSAFSGSTSASLGAHMLVELM